MKGLVLCGDLRSGFLYNRLFRERLDIDAFGVFERKEDGTSGPVRSYPDKKEILSIIREYDYLILPMPVTKDNICLQSMENGCSLLLSELQEKLCAGQLLFGGSIPAGIKELGYIRIKDFMESDEVAIRNGIATAEGAVAEAIHISDSNLHGKHALVLGYGRCGKILARKLSGMGARLTIAVRRPEVKWDAESQGYQGVLLTEIGNALEYDFIFNTIPQMVLSKEQQKAIPKDTFILEIAGSKGGFAPELIPGWKNHYRNLRGLPGKYSPKESGEILAEYVMNELRKEQEWN